LKRATASWLIGLALLCWVARSQAADTLVLSLPPVSFQPANGGTQYVIEQGGVGRLCPSSGAGYFVARLVLDPGTRIEHISAFIEDENREAMGMMSLVRRTPGSFVVLATTSVSNGTGEIERVSTDAIDSPVVDDGETAYLLQLVLTGPKVCFHGAQVRYR
jgi:hypothetical protein